MTTLSLRGKSALVTGGARRIGRAVALTLAESGADLTITYLTSQTDADQVIASIQRLDCRAQALRCDLRSEKSVRETVEAAAAFHGHLDIVVNNAAVFESAALDRLTLAQWDAIFETNARGPFLVARDALPYLRKSRGRIVNIGSLGGIHAWPEHAHYCASKAALHMLTQAMAKAFAPEVCVNCVAPGWIELDRTDSSESQRFASKTPLRRNGTASDVAQAVLFFAANSGFVTGQILVVDGGLGL